MREGRLNAMRDSATNETFKVQSCPSDAGALEMAAASRVAADKLGGDGRADHVEAVDGPPERQLRDA